MQWLAPAPEQRWRCVREALQDALMAAIALGGLAFFAWWTNRSYPMEHWLIFGYAGQWLLCLVFAASSLVAGWRALSLLLREPPPLDERLVLAFALGVLLFFWGVFVGGLLGLFGRGMFFALPALLFAWGAPRALQDARRLGPRLAPFGAKLFAPRSGLELLSGALLVIGTVAVYLQVMNPHNLGADAHGYHLPIAEHYAAAGKIRPLADGWYVGIYPQLASILYTWAYQSPGAFPFHTALCSHLEFTLFLATLPSVSVLARRLSGGRLPYAAAAMYLYPGLFLYDSTLITGADHVLAFWAPPIALSLLRVGRRFVVCEAVLSALLLGGAVLTKYQGSYFFVVSALCIAGLTARARALRPLLAWCAAGLLATSAHWLKNWVFYGDPFYPLLHAIFPSHPFHVGAEKLLDNVYSPPWFNVQGTPLEKLEKTLLILVSFSFDPHNWGAAEGLKPAFGSLFTLLVPVVALLRPRRALWLLVAGTHVAILVWFRTSAQDRFLQALVPWMAACTAATLALAWRRGAAVRAAVGALVAFQLVWGGDVYFYRKHAWIGDNPLKSLVDWLGYGEEGRYQERDRPVEDLLEIGKALPPHAKLLLHNLSGNLGLGAESLHDEPGWQGGIEYAELETPAATRALWARMSATHVSWYGNRGATSQQDLARESVFARTLALYTSSSKSMNGRLLAQLSPEPNDRGLAEAPTRIAWLGCGGDPTMGLYTPRQLGRRPPEIELAMTELSRSPLAVLAPANALVLRHDCDGLGSVGSRLSAEWTSSTEAGDVRIWVRHRAHPGP